MQKVRVKGKELKKGYWTYLSNNIGKISIKKGEDSFKLDIEDLECVKILDKFYDVESIENGVVKLTEPVDFDYEGDVYDEAQLPIVIRRERELFELIIKQDKFMPKGEKKKITLNKASKDIKTFYIQQMKEEGYSDINPTETILIINEENEKNVMSNNIYIKQLLELVVFIDMNYEIDGKSLWQVMGIEKDNYVELAKYLSSEDIGIISDRDDIDRLKYTIEAVKLGKSVELYVLEQQTKSLAMEARATMASLRKNFSSDEEFDSFMNGLNLEKGE